MTEIDVALPSFQPNDSKMSALCFTLRTHLRQKERDLVREIPTPVFIATVGAITGGALALAEAGSQPFISVGGLVVIVISVMYGLASKVIGAIEKVNRPADVAFEQGYEMGRDAGYIEGRRADRPVLVIPDRRKANGG